MRLISTMSFHAGRTTACAGVVATARSTSTSCGGSRGVCSVSTTRKSKPTQPSASAVIGAPLPSQVPIGVPVVIARLNPLRGRSMRWPELIDGQSEINTRTTAERRALRKALSEYEGRVYHGAFVHALRGRGLVFSFLTSLEPHALRRHRHLR